MSLIVKSNIKKAVKDLQGKEEEVGTALERKTEEILRDAVKRAKANGRRTLQARDL